MGDKRGWGWLCVGGLLRVVCAGGLACSLVGVGDGPCGVSLAGGLSGCICGMVGEIGLGDRHWGGLAPVRLVHASMLRQPICFCIDVAGIKS